MRHYLRLILVTFTLAAGFAAGRWTHAQAPAQRPDLPTPRGQAPVILSGPDIGFRLDGPETRDGRPTGRLVVRIDGRWVEPQWAMGVRPLTGQ
jgi:hypothetical protein